MDLETLRFLVGALDEVLQRVEPGGKVRVLGSRLERLEVVRVAAPSNLDKDRVQVGGTRPGEQVVDLLGRLEAIVKGVNPHRAQLRRIEGDAYRGRRSRWGQGWRSWRERRNCGWQCCCYWRDDHTRRCGTSSRRRRWWRRGRAKRHRGDKRERHKGETAHQ